MSLVAQQAARVSGAALDYLNAVLQISFHEWSDQLEAGVSSHAAACAHATAAVEARLNALGRSQTEYSWGASIFIARAAVVAELSPELPHETRVALGRPWAQLVAQ